MNISQWSSSRSRSWADAGVANQDVGQASGVPLLARGKHQIVHHLPFADHAVAGVGQGLKTSEELGQHRWGAKLTHPCRERCRRIAVRYQRRPDIHLGITTLAATSTASTSSNDSRTLSQLVPVVPRMSCAVSSGRSHIGK